MSRCSLIIFSLLLSFSLVSAFQDTIKVRFDFKKNLVYLERWRDSVFLGVISVETFEDYLKRSFKEKFLYNLNEELKAKRERTLAYQTGLIPVIELPSLPLFGESKIKISGEDRITFGGRQTVYSSPLQRAPSGRLLPELKMSQELRLTVTGEIGEKTKINIDHDSRRMEAKNKISVSYSGTEDEIIRKLEGGDISFGFPSTRYTGDIPSHKGLFGLRSEGAFGPINFYAVASREQSEKREAEFKGKASVKVDTFYDYEYAKYRFFILDTNPHILLKINNFQLFYDDGNPYNDIQTNAIRCLATIYPDFPDSQPVNSDERIKAGFIRLEINKDFYLRTLTILPYGEIPVIELNIPVEGGNLACFYTTFEGDTVGGKRYQDSLLLLKLIKKRRFDSNSPTFKYNLRNIYYLGEKNIRIKMAKIFRVSGSYFTEYETEGDYKGETFLKILGLDPDNNGEINFPYFQSGYGIIVFPYLYPFNSEKLSVKDSVIYFKEPLSYGEGGKYLIVIEYASSIQEFSLGTTDIIENSEKVYINGILAEKGVDYNIDYKQGKITFLRLPPDAEIKVTFEQLPLFAISAKTFGGFRAETKLFENLTLGSSFLVRSEGTYTDKPEIGEEPFNKGIFSFNLSYLKDFDFLKIQIGGELASSFENSNTLNNAYIDNFEETSLEHNLEVKGSYFFFAPCPYFGDTNNFIKIFPKIRNPKEINYIRRDSVFGPQIGEEGREKDNYLIIEVDNNLNNNSWFGLCQALIRGSSFQLENYENLEMIFRIDSGDYDGDISFSLASYLEEDVPRRTKDGRIVGYNNIFDSEDKNGNNELEIDEDVGLDGVEGFDSLNILEDDKNDDYDENFNPMGTEKNRLLNSEDIDLQGFDPRGNNHYYSYTISLKNSKNIKELYNNWKVLVIPLRAFDTVIGRPNLNDIRKLAIYFHNFSNSFKMRIYSIKFSGIRWKKPRFLSREIDTLISKARIYSVSNKNAPEYTSPFKVKKDLRGIYNEASLCLEIDSFSPYDTCITEMFLSVGQDLRKYSQISFYFHKPKNIEERAIMLYFRIGLDSSNFYAFLLPLEEREGFYKIRKVPYGENWYEIQIFLDSLPLIKIGKYFEGARIKGEPSLNNVRYYALGVCNVLPSKISYNVWFNDLRANRPKNKSGLIYGINTNFNIPNLGFNTSFNIEKQNPFFSRLTQTPTPATNDNLNYFLNSSFDLSKIPYLSLLGFSLPINYNKTLSLSKPYYSPSIPDLVLKDKIFEGKSGSESYNFSLRRSKTSQNPLLKYSIDAFSYSFSKRFGFSNQPLSIDTSTTLSQNFSYNISPELGIKIKDEKVKLFPNNISLSLSLSDNESKRRNRAKEKDTFTIQPRVITKNAGFSYSFAYSPISDLNIEYSCGNYFNRLGVFKTGLKEKKTFLGVDEGFNRDVGISYNFSLFEILEPNFSIDGSYDEGREKIRGDTYTDKRRITNDFSFSFATDLDLPEIFDRLKLEKLSDYFDVINFDYNFSRGTEYPKIDFRPGLLYQFGLSEKLPYDSSQRAKDREYSLELSSSFRLSSVSIRWSYGKDWEKSFYGLSSRQGSREIKFPSLDIAVSNVEKLLPKLISSSQINTKFEKRKTLSSRLAPDGSFIWGERNEEISYDFFPLIGWQLNFKNRMNASITINYKKGHSYNALSNLSNYNENKSFSLSYGYTFSLKEGIKLPLLKKIKLTQDINFNGNFSYNLNESYYIRELQKTFLSRSNNYNLSLSFSYQLSTYTQVGLNASYSNSRNLLKQDKMQTIDINIWVLFRF
ncbi:MAG: hypothetical protein N2323_01075 [candidate division WOR-3 bacterium]|nr:hypothetical protein [candidate division WOR-3 bacterium]MCX7836538.1 hypothetical protein [candidate division WOR-3 bacterium]MDW8113776.1 hypothetical protein [candidate division WOR-3 bacterium]